jgi:hypothetical protein
MLASLTAEDPRELGVASLGQCKKLLSAITAMCPGHGGERNRHPDPSLPQADLGHEEPERAADAEDC